MAVRSVGPPFRRGGPPLSAGGGQGSQPAQPAVPLGARADRDRRPARRGYGHPRDRRGDRTLALDDQPGDPAQQRSRRALAPSSCGARRQGPCPQTSEEAGCGRWSAGRGRRPAVGEAVEPGAGRARAAFPFRRPAPPVALCHLSPMPGQTTSSIETLNCCDVDWNSHVYSGALHVATLKTFMAAVSPRYID